MIPTSYKIPSYQDIPEMSEEKVRELIKSGGKVVLYDELVIDVKSINHPGGSIILKPFINNLTANIKASFVKYNHSRYAEVLLCLNAIGKFKHDELNSKEHVQKPEGKYLFEKVHSYEDYRLHQNALKKIDFSKPIFTQIDQLTIEEKQCLVDIPTTIESSGKVKFKDTETKEFMYTTNFWRSTVCFQILAIVGIFYLFSQNLGTEKLINLLPYFFFGLAKWTLIEYYFHRFLLHQDLNKQPTLESHLMHHAFPSIKNKLALSISQVIIYLIGFYLVYSLFLDREQTISLILGILVGLILYDITHYYFHFGPEINISFLTNLRRNHLKHHYRNPNQGFGVSNTFWDKIFRTEHEN